MTRGEIIKQANIKKYGSEEAYKAHMKEIAKRNRPNSKGGAFNDVELARVCGRIGGLKSRIKK